MPSSPAVRPSLLRSFLVTLWEGGKEGRLGTPAADQWAWEPASGKKHLGAVTECHGTLRDGTAGPEVSLDAILAFSCSTGLR